MLKLLLIIPILQIVCTSAQDIKIQSAKQTESPWMVYFEVKGKRCGGAMIDDTHVLTAAHCFDRVKYSEFQNLKKLREAVKIRIGEWKTETDPDCGDDVSDEICDTTADILPKEVIIHENYTQFRKHNDARFAYDIAIITLGWPPRRSEVINVLRLESPERCHDSISGEFWKTTGFGGETSVKKRMEMVLLSHEECVKSIDESHLGKLNETVHVCGRGLNGEKTCKGDAGNPVTNLFEGVPYLQGIVTFTDEEECVETETNTASVFLRVPCFFDWIHSKVPNIEHAFIEKPKPKPTSGENEDTGSIEVYSAGESTTGRPLGTTSGKNGPREYSTSTPRPVTKQTTRTTTTRKSITRTTSTTEATAEPDETVDYNEEPEVSSIVTEKQTPKTSAKPTQSWRRPVTPKPATTTTPKPATTTSKPDEPTTEDERIHFLKGNNTTDAGFDVRVGDVGHDKDEEETTSTAKPSRFSRPQKIVRTSAKPVEYDEY